MQIETTIVHVSGQQGSYSLSTKGIWTPTSKQPTHERSPHDQEHVQYNKICRHEKNKVMETNGFKIELKQSQKAKGGSPPHMGYGEDPSMAAKPAMLGGHDHLTQAAIHGCLRNRQGGTSPEAQNFIFLIEIGLWTMV